MAPKVKIVTASGGDATTDVNTLLSYRNSGTGWGGYLNQANSNFHTALALQALKAANYTDQSVIYPALSYLLSTQNPDGGWGFYQGDDSNIYVTAQVLSTLARFRTVYIVEPQLASAASFLLSSQNPDGGFGVGSSIVYETALAFIALIESGQGQAQPLQNAGNYLTATQSANGSWNDDPYSTALALRALSYVKPDLAIATANIAVSPNSPTVGDSLTVTAIVANIGLEAATGVVVRLLDNGASIGEQTIPTINPGATVPATFAIAPLAAVGEHVLTVAIDPANTINEVSKTNNSANVRLWAKAPADLVVTPDFLTVTPAYLKPGESVTLAFAVANMGESAAGSFSAILYDGDPNAGGIQLGTVTMAGIAAGAWGEGSFTFTPATAGVHTLTLVADPQHAITELSTANNTARKDITVNTTSGAGFIDLAIPMNGIRLDPARPASGATVTVTIAAVNNGTEAATADLELFDSDPAAGGTLLQKATVTLNAGETRSVAVPWQVPPGIRTLRAYIDRLNAGAERDETNNSQILPVMADMVDIEVSASDIAIAPEHPMDGDPVTVKVTVQNRGIKATGPFNVNLYNGDPNSGGTLLQTLAIADLPGDGTVDLTYPFTAARGTYRFYAVCDPDNKVAELYEDNNTAIRSLLVKSSAEAKGPDLVPLEFDLSATTTDPQSLRISGMAKVKFQNKGDDKVATPFRITVFEDKDNDGVYTEGTDQALGSWDYATPMNPNMVGVVSINLSGTVTFRDAPIYALVDSGQAVFEQNEINNTIRRGAACAARPANPIEPVVKWQWPRTPDPTLGRILSTPVVISLTDDNGDDKIDNYDKPAILVNAFAGNYQTLEGKLWAFKGDTGDVSFTRFVTGQAPYEGGYPIVGDIDGDGKPEIVIKRRFGVGLLALAHDGTLKWDNSAQVTAWRLANPGYSTTMEEGNIPVLADLDGDGHSEIIYGPTIFNWDGSVRCAPDYRLRGGAGMSNGFGYSVSVADLDMDGKQEIIAGYTAYNNDCTIKWINSSLTDGFTAVGNFDNDPYPEVVLLTNLNPPPFAGGVGGRVYLLDHTGQVKWGPVFLKNLEPTAKYDMTGGHTVIADFDGDGKPEIGIRGESKYLILDSEGRLKMTLAIPNSGWQMDVPAPSVFDLNGDGRPKVLIHSGPYFRVFEGKDGTLLFEENIGQVGDYSSVVIADVDGDGHAEAVVTGNYGYGPTSGSLRVYGAKNNDWVGTRRIWNQPSYHSTNINDDGSIPQYETPSWLTNNNYRCNVPTTPSTGSPYLAADLSASFVRVDMANYPSSVAITTRIGNGGAKAVDAGVKTAFHDGDPATGGTLIGTATTTRTLNPGDYEDVTITWNAPAEGNHTIQVTADADGVISECDKTNNIVTLPVFVTTGRPDLVISAEDIAIPASIPEGTLADIAVTVRNSGTLNANNILVRVYAGNPATGGKQIGADQVIPTIAIGGAATIHAAWNTLAAQGTTYLYAVVDPLSAIAEINKANNTAIREVLVTPADKPDLQVTAADITITPAAPNEGDQLTIAANIHNLGQAVGNIKLALYDGNPAAGGKRTGETVIPQLIPQGGSSQAVFTLSTIGLSGNHTFHIVADPDNTITESNETNNQGMREVFIQAAGLRLDAITDKQEYTANEEVRITLSANELNGTARNLGYDVTIIAETGTSVATVTADTPVSLAAKGNIALTAAWNTGTTFSGSYLAVVRLKDAGKDVAQASAPFTILPVKTATANISADKLTYTSSESAAITAAITSTSPNFPFADLTFRLTLEDSSGTTVFTETRTIASLTPGGRFEMKKWWNCTGSAKGTYQAKVEILDGTTLLASANTTFQIVSSATSGAGLSGTVAVQPTTIEAGTTGNLTFTVTNRGNEDISAYSLRILLTDPDTGELLKTIEAPQTEPLPINGTKTGNIPFSTSNLRVKTILAILLYDYQGNVKSLTGAPFEVKDTTPPVLVISTLKDGAFTAGETLNIAGTAKDEGGMQELRINDIPVPLNADGSFSHTVILKPGGNPITTTALDRSGNRTTDTRTINLDQNAPVITITTPPDNSATAGPAIQVAGTTDEPASIEVRIGEPVQYFNGTSFSTTVALVPGLNTIDIKATDQAGNPANDKRTVIFDDQKPSLAITDPGQDLRTNQGSITVKGTVTDALTQPTVTITMGMDTFTPQVTNGAFEQAVSFAEEKTYEIQVTAKDAAGNETSVQRNVIHDITKPVLTIDPVATPTDRKSQVISGTREEGCTVTVTSPTATVGTVAYPTATTWQAAVSALSDGANIISAATVDPAGNQSTTTTTIVVTTTAPVVTVTASPATLWPPNHKLVPVTVRGNILTTATDMESVLISISDEYGKYNYKNLPSGSTVYLEAWRNGDDMDGRVYTVTATATDKAGNTATAVTSVVVPHDMGKQGCSGESDDEDRERHERKDGHHHHSDDDRDGRHDRDDDD
ncbi:CARDB domain-containing protein [Geotalea uraniireducens]|uniref:CARDB domain-containing protein n=1 Tax=Geotalea uraniireducens TaxID=351604 RepID=UPI0002FA637C|nr:CARDB domain-containing protein [Geotalea uraniireducens]